MSFSRWNSNFCILLWWDWSYRPAKPGTSWEGAGWPCHQNQRGRRRLIHRSPDSQANEMCKLKRSYHLCPTGILSGSFLIPLWYQVMVNVALSSDPSLAFIISTSGTGTQEVLLSTHARLLWWSRWLWRWQAIIRAQVQSLLGNHKIPLAICSWNRSIKFKLMYMPINRNIH